MEIYILNHISEVNWFYGRNLRSLKIKVIQQTH